MPPESNNPSGNRKPSTKEILQRLQAKRKQQAQQRQTPPQSSPAQPVRKTTAKKPVKSYKKPPLKPEKKLPERTKTAPQEKPVEKPPARTAEQAPANRTQEPSRVSSRTSKRPSPVDQSPADSPFASQKSKPGRFVSTTIISKHLYEQVRQYIFKRWLLHLVYLCLFCLVVSYGIIWLVSQYGKKSEIVELAQQGLVAFDEDRLEESEQMLLLALQRYKVYLTGYKKHLWFNDSVTETTMMQTAFALGSMGDLEAALETLKQISIHNVYNENHSVSLAFHETVKNFAFSSIWTEDDLKLMYNQCLNMRPQSWQNGERELVRVTEWFGMQLHPVATRFNEADLVMYGHLTTSGESTFSFNAETIYKSDLLPGEFTVHLPTRMTDAERDRLQWYMQNKPACILFCSLPGGETMLNGLTGIMLSENPFVEEFNAVLDAQ